MQFAGRFSLLRVCQEFHSRNIFSVWSVLVIVGMYCTVNVRTTHTQTTQQMNKTMDDAQCVEYLFDWVHSYNEENNW